MHGRPASLPRVAVCAVAPEGQGGWSELLRTALPNRAFEVFSCATPERLLEGSAERAPDAILYRPDPSRGADPEVLRALRRVHPATPLVIVSEGTSLDALRRAQEFRPVFHVVEPLDPLELRDVIDGAIHQRARRYPAQP
jgi:DNA-binding NtrC family response regulator